MMMRTASHFQSVTGSEWVVKSGYIELVYQIYINSILSTTEYVAWFKCGLNRANSRQGSKHAMVHVSIENK